MTIDQGKQDNGGGGPPNLTVSRATLWRQAAGAALAPFADPRRVPVMLQALAPLLEGGARVRFSNHTGLVRSVRGLLWPDGRADSPNEARAIGDAFLSRYGLALFGSDRKRWREAPAPLVGTTFCWRQVDAAGVPVYGARAALDFDEAGQLRMVVSNWHPLAPDHDHRPARPLEEAFGIAMDAVRRYVAAENEALSKRSDKETGTKSFYTPGELDPVFGDEMAKGLVIMPLYKQPGGYRAAWVVRVLDRKFGRSWEVIVNAETDGDLVLGVAPLYSELTVQVFMSSVEALLNNPKTSVALQDILNAFPGGSPQPDGSDPRLVNVSFHLGRAAASLDACAQRAWRGPVAQPRELPGRAGGPQLLIDLNSTGGLSLYDHGTGTLHVGGGNNMPDHAFDCEVVYHEYAHAVFSRLQHDLVDANQPGDFRAAVNEGLAFYLACAQSERSPADKNPQRWGDFAYNSAEFELERSVGQLPNFDFLTDYGLFPGYTSASLSGPIYDSGHAAGMVWARALWDIHRILGFELADSAILRAMPLLGGIHTEFETAAEVIMHSADMLLGGANLALGGTVERALQLAFNSRGVTADGPVNGLQTVTVGADTLALAAVENVAGQQGCQFSADGVKWEPLGSGGLAQISALAVVRRGPTETVVLAAGPEQGSQADAVYRYNLSSPVNTSSPWIRVGQAGQPTNLLGGAEILSLAGVFAQAGALRVFIGTERGLFQHDGAAWAAVPLVEQGQDVLAMPIFSLAAVPFNNGLAVLVGSLGGLSAITPPASGQQSARQVQLEQGERPFEATLAIVAVQLQAGGITAWAATASGAIYRFDGVQWAPAGELLTQRPAYSLIADPAAGEPNAICLGSTGAVWRLPGPGAAAAPLPPALGGLAVSALGRTPAGDLLAGTLERGLWLRQAGSWQPITSGPARVGRLVDAIAPPGPWSQRFRRVRPLNQDEAAAHVVYLPADRTSMTIVDQNPALGATGRLALYYAAPAIDPGGAPPQPAGLERLAFVIGTPAARRAGYYILCIGAAQQLQGYDLAITLA